MFAAGFRSILGVSITPPYETYIMADSVGEFGRYVPWDNQLRQPILLHTHNAVIAEAPIEGFLHPYNNLDTLGIDRRKSACRKSD